MKYCISIYGAPYSSQASQTAYRFTQAAIKRGHSIERLFFYIDGVHNASALAAPPQDEANLPEQWQALIGEHNLDSVVCIAAAVRRGMLNESEATRYEKPSHNMLDGFTLSGLGQFIEAAAEADRVVTFGA